MSKGSKKKKNCKTCFNRNTCVLYSQWEMIYAEALMILDPERKSCRNWEDKVVYRSEGNET